MVLQHLQLGLHHVFLQDQLLADTPRAKYLPLRFFTARGSMLWFN